MYWPAVAAALLSTREDTRNNIRRDTLSLFDWSPASSYNRNEVIHQHSPIEIDNQLRSYVLMTLSRKLLV